jgi:hypothetical protein
MACLSELRNLNDCNNIIKLPYTGKRLLLESDRSPTRKQRAQKKHKIQPISLETVVHLSITSKLTIRWRNIMTSQTGRGGYRGKPKPKLPEHLKRVQVNARIQKWMLDQLKEKGEVGYILEEILIKSGFRYPEK